MKRTAYLALGANIGDTEANLRAAATMLRERGCEVTGASSLYLTKPIGVTDQPDFTNAVVSVMTSLDPHDLLDTCRRIERELGREKTIRWGPRVMDVDILLYEGADVDDDELVIPHPRILDRAFVLVPLAEIAPDIEVAHGVTAREAAQRIDQTGVRKVADSSWGR